MRDVIIGIDLGTTTTEAAVYRNGKAEMIPSFDGSFVIPSAVGIDDSGNMVVGERARAQYVLAPERTAIEIKRKIGTGEKICLGRNEYTAVELSAKILEYVKRYAEEYLEMPVNRAVISVPAYFDDIQRRETAEAGKLAGFTVERIINEPTAAALSYGIGHLEEESHILVYDLGGGTFDVTVLELFEGVLEVKASSGDNRLGGKDLDQRLIDWLAGRFEEKTGVSLKGNVYAASRLKEAAEQCKIALSSQEEATVRIPMLAQDGQTPLGLEETVSREQFEGLIEKEIHRTKGPVQTALGDSGVSCGELDRILLAGGSTRIPLVRREIRDMLGKEPSEAIHPEYSIALGAAIQAGIISRAIDGEDSMVLTDVNPYTLGIRAMGWESDDEMSVIIPRNVTIPVTRKQTYYTSWDGQQAAAIEVYQGEKRRASRNHLIGSFDIGGIPPAPAGKEQIEVSFSYNLDGILQVAAKVVSTGKEASVTIHMGQEETKEDVSGWKESGLAADFRSVIRRGEKALKKAAERGDKELAGELEETLYDLKYAVLKELQVRAEELEEDLRDLIEEGEQ